MHQLPILAIDISNSKIISTIAKPNPNGTISIFSVGYAKSQGISKGKIINMDSFGACIKESIDNTKRYYNGEFSKVFVGIPSVYAKSQTSKAMVNLPAGHISIKEIKTVLNAAIDNCAISLDQEVLHVTPIGFMADNSHIQDPQNYVASHLEAKVNIITVSKSYLNNIKQAIRNCSIDCTNFIVDSYASSIALMENELDVNKKQLGHLIIDIGSSSTNATIFKGSSIVYSKFYPIGGDNISKDISIMLSATLEDANNLKLKYNSILPNSENARTKIKIAIEGNENASNEATIENISTFIHSRIEELFYLIKDDIDDTNMFNSFKSGVILSGGTSKIEGLKELCFKVFEGQKVVRLDFGTNIANEYLNLTDPSYTSTVGLIMYATTQFPNYEIDSSKNLRATVKDIDKPKEPIEEPKQPTGPKPKSKKVGADLTDLDLTSSKFGFATFLKKIKTFVDQHL